MVSGLLRTLLSRRPWRQRAAALTLAGAAVLAIAGLAPNLLPSIEERVGDMLWRFDAALLPVEEQERRFVVVDID